MGKRKEETPLSSIDEEEDEEEEEDDDTECFKCGSKGDADKMLLCDGCDKGYHIFCLQPKLTKVTPLLFVFFPLDESLF